MTTPACTEERFLGYCKDHKMTVLRDDGVYRHLQFRGKSFAYWFDLITWPGNLCITGDCGTYVFRRLEDMFEFFRRDGATGGIPINPSYWSEKVQASDRDGVKQFSTEAYEENVKRWLDDYIDGSWRMDEGDKDATALREAVQYELLDDASDDESASVGRAIDFEFQEHRPFQEFWDCSSREYTMYFLWCCYAVAWGVQQYDAATSKEQAA